MSQEASKQPPVGIAPGVSEPLADVGIISPTDLSLTCAICNESITRDLGEPKTYFTSDPTKTVRPHFCATCRSWYHAKCAAASDASGKERRCPRCTGGKTKLEAASFYCFHCKSAASVHANSRWPRVTCFKCQNPTALAALYFVGLGEIGWLVGVGVLSLAGFITSLAMGASRPVIILASSAAVVFALPWVLLIVAVIVSSMMPMGINIGEIGGWGGNIDNILFRQVEQFRAKSRLRRFAQVYLWVMVNAISAVFVLAAGLAILYAITHMKK